MILLYRPYHLLYHHSSGRQASIIGKPDAVSVARPVWSGLGAHEQWKQSNAPPINSVQGCWAKPGKG